MRDGLRPGMVATRELVVTDENTADGMGNRGVRVLGTPAVVLLVEGTAYMLVQPYLDDGEGMVGTRIELDHVAPAFPGAAVRCTARLDKIDGRRLFFEVEVRDDHDVLAYGRYRGYVLLLEPFLDRARNKSRTAEGSIPGNMA